MVRQYSLPRPIRKFCTMPKASSREIEVIRFTQPVPYPEMLAKQQARQRAVDEGKAPNTLYLLEHHPVITLGREARQEHILATPAQLQAAGIEQVEAARGGSVTYHGPGQLIAYPILDLKQWRPSVGWYLRRLEEVLIRQLATYELQSHRLKGYTGVWVAGAKIAAIGVGLRHWVTSHGAALNIAPNNDHWRMIIPCGLGDKPVTSLREQLPQPPAMAETMQRFEDAFLDAFR